MPDAPTPVSDALAAETYELPRLMTERERKISRSCFRCPRCEAAPNLIEQRLLTDTETIFCRGCDCSYSCTEAVVLVGYGSQKFLYPEQVRNAYWWHATSQSDWPVQPLASPDTPRVHVGTYQAAMIRAASYHRGQIFLHRVELVPGATLSDFFLFDSSDWGARPNLHDVYRYVNRWESPGSISLLVRPECLVVTDRRRLVR